MLFQERKVFYQPWFCLGNSALSLSHSLSLTQPYGCHTLPGNSSHVCFFCISVGYFFLCSCVDINWNNTVIDLALTHLAGAEINWAWAKNTIIPKLLSMIIPNTLKHFNSKRAFHWSQILNKAGHICGCFTCLVKSACQAFDFCLNRRLIPYCRHQILFLFHFLHLISLLPECYTANGEDYRGFQNQTSLHGGKPCLFWNETFQHPYNTLKYPNGEGGLGSHNYCRWGFFSLSGSLLIIIPAEMILFLIIVIHQVIKPTVNLMLKFSFQIIRLRPNGLS